MAADECQTNKTNIENIFGFTFSVLKTLFQGVLVVSGAIGYDWCDRADGIFLPYLKATFELLAVYCDIVIDWEKYFRLGLFCDLESPVHWIIWGSVEVDSSFPLISFLVYAHLLHWFLVVPNYVYLLDYWAVHCCVPVEIFHELGIISCSSVSDCDESESEF